MELARNPTDANISNWITYNKKKNELNQRLQKRMTEYLAQNNKLTSDVQKIIAENSVDTKTKFDPSRYRIRMYFDSNCPHCKRMFSTLLTLQAQGIYVEALQIDDADIKKSQYPIPVRKAQKAEVKKHNITSVPHTLIADLKKKALYPPIKGYQSVARMTALINEGEKL